MSEFRGARGSNTGDDFHELWGTRQAIRLLANEDDLEAITVEGLTAEDEAGASPDTWDGIDCAEYFGGRSAATATRVRLEQLKYSAANPTTPWTIARLVAGGRREKSVIARLAKAWKALRDQRPDASAPEVVLISNQPLAEEVVETVTLASAARIKTTTRKPTTTSAATLRLAYATGLNSEDFQEFARSLRFEAGAGSRLALEENVLAAIAAWTDLDVQQVVNGLRRLVRTKMRPEFAGELITRETLLLHFGTSDGAALFPCPSEISRIESPILRGPVKLASNRLLAGAPLLCLHGNGGVGKTTALQEVEAALPPASVMVVYDCYGGGSYLDASELRHKASDAFVQLTNELAGRLRLPLLLTRQHHSDYPRLFATRLKHAADALAARDPGALLVIAIDAADNAVTAAKSRAAFDPSPAFVHDFLTLRNLPTNVRFIVTARTGRLNELVLPADYEQIEIKPFSLAETGENVRRVWSAPQPWIDDFHHLSAGVPRVQTYAFQFEGRQPVDALDRLRPGGRSLDAVFRQQFSEAVRKAGEKTEVSRLCAGLIALARPVPVVAIAAVLGVTAPQIIDICSDLAPGIRLHDGQISFADEDFEFFVRAEGEDTLPNVQKLTADWMLKQADHDRYAALNVASALAAAGRGPELLALVEAEPSPVAVPDPVMRREAEVQRLRLAITVCRDAGDPARALRFVLIGAEGIKTENALRDLLVNNPDLAARFALETVSRLILSNPDHIEDHGPLLFQRLSVDADRGDAISVREGRRSLQAWLQARDHHRLESTHRRRTVWEIGVSDISSAVEAAIKLDGAGAGLKVLASWTPRRLALDVALTLAPRLIAEGRASDVEAIVTHEDMGHPWTLLLQVPLALSGRTIDLEMLAKSLSKLSGRLGLTSFFKAYSDQPNAHGQVLDAALTACEILSYAKVEPDLIDRVLAMFLAPELRQIGDRHHFESTKLDLLFRAYALQEARAGRRAKIEDIFIPRPPQPDAAGKRRARSDQDQDRPLLELGTAILGIYISTAEAFARHRTDDVLTKAFEDACNRMESEDWRISRHHGSGALRAQAAKAMLGLLACDYSPALLKEFATRIHGRWRRGYEIPNRAFIERMGLKEELHDSLLDDLSAAAVETRRLRIGADEKSKTLVEIARLIQPLSNEDANVVFNQAVEAASELDREVYAQIRLIDRFVEQGITSFEAPRETALNVSDVIADAAIRLDDDRHFPWSKAMSAVARLDPVLALANAARWDDEGNAGLAETLMPLVLTGLAQGTLTAAHAAALAHFLNRDHGLLEAAIKAAPQDERSALIEAAAWDSVVRFGHERDTTLFELIQSEQAAGQWAQVFVKQDQFVQTFPAKVDREGDNAPFGSSRERSDPLADHHWSTEALTDPGTFSSTIKALQRSARDRDDYLALGVILDHARAAVSRRYQVAHLAALAQISDVTLTDDAVVALLKALKAWVSTPAVQAWRDTVLSAVIVQRLPEFARYYQYGEGPLTEALALVNLSGPAVSELLLSGVQRHVDAFGSEGIFALAGLIGSGLAPAAISELVDWYAKRLSGRIPAEDRDRSVDVSSLPISSDAAVGRFIFAYLGDSDLRVRWRAAHAVRRLAALGDRATLAALSAEYARESESLFRSQDVPFFWLGARLWFVMAWSRVSLERPDLADQVLSVLLPIALDKDFPHLLIRAAAKEACERLVSRGLVVLDNETASALAHVNQTPLERMPATDGVRRHFGHRDDAWRFKFDTMDTLPYWYTPLLRSFAAVTADEFRETAEHWIIDVWGHDGDTRSIDRERGRRRSSSDRDWSLSGNRHGSVPTLERLHTYLEWHGMWLAAGQLLKTEALAKHDSPLDWDDLFQRVRRELPPQPPLWAADLRTSKPPVVRNWIADERPLKVWAPDVKEAQHRAEIFPNDVPGYLVVSGLTEVRTGGRTEVTRISTALANPETSASLVRALQMMGDAWDYKLPDENDTEFEIDVGPYGLHGWLRDIAGDSGIDGKDPNCGSIDLIDSMPGRRVTEACSLERDGAGLPHWSNASSVEPMFVFHSWGEKEKDDERHMVGLEAAGHRLLANRRQLLEFLRAQDLDLIAEVEINRRGRDRGYDSDEEEEVPEGRFDRLYSLGRDGTVSIAEGPVGAWTDDRQAT